MTTQHTLQPFFLTTEQGERFACYYPAHTQPKAQLLFIAPLAEELNKVRHLVSRQARLLAQQGYSCLVMDLYGCGDSEGVFEQARWPIWLDDVTAAYQWLQQQCTAPVALWACRAGALLAVDWLVKHPATINHLIAWQPQWNGMQVIQGLLRLRKIADEVKQQGQSMAQIRAALAQGPLEIAGYWLAPQLAQSIEAIQLKQCTLPVPLQLDWLNLIADNSLQAATQAILQQLQQQSVQVTLHQHALDEAFWLVNEPQHQPSLYQFTLQCLENHYGAH